MEEMPVKTFLIPNDLCRRSGVSSAWLPGNKLGVFPTEPIKHDRKDLPSRYYSKENPTQVSVFQFRQDVALFHPILRRLVAEASGIFNNLQLLAASKPADFKQKLSQFSVQYRSIIRACLENLRDEVMRIEGAEKEELHNYVTIFYSVECIWHLCEILYIENIPGYVVINHLLDWVRFHFPKYERKAAVLLSGEMLGIESNPDYWETVTGSLLQGRIEVVRALLSLHSSSHCSHFKLADQILKSMPLYGIYEGVSVTEFNLRRKHWLLDAQSKIDAKMFTSDSNLNFIMRLLVGEELAWSEAQSHCENWYQLLAAWLFFTEPTVKSFELGNFAKRCISRMGVTMRHLDRVLLAAMEGDVEIVKEIQQMTDNGWFVNHFTDLLYHCGQLDKWQTDKIGASKLRESFIIEYGTLLMGHQSLWQIGLNYLDHCPTEGLSTIELFLPRISIPSEAKANKIIREALKRGLSSIIQSVSKIQGIVSLRSGRLGNALIWALKSQDSNFVSFIADQCLKQYVKTGVLPHTDLFNYLGSCMMACDRLIFLGKYYEFHKLYKAKSYREAGIALMSLIASKFSPKYFWGTLLSEALTLLECEELVLSSNDTFNLLNCLEERASDEDLKDKVQIIRLGISRNLARALTFEAQFM